MIQPFRRRPKSASSSTKGVIPYDASLCCDIPAGLGFDKIISGQTCYPCTVKDFMTYLRFVEHNSENLQFFLWLQDYTTRFASLAEGAKPLSPCWPSISAQVKAASVITAVPVDVDDKPQSNDSLHTHAKCQPFREEVEAVRKLFFEPTSTKELNLTARERLETNLALSYTTHPSAFASALVPVEQSLRYQSHPGFVKYASSNGNSTRLEMAQWFGCMLFILALVMGVLLTLSCANRWWRVMGTPLMFLSMMAILDARKGLCMSLVSQGYQRHLMPWELWDEGEIEMQAFADEHKEEDEKIAAWLEEYQKKPVYFRVFEKTMKVEEPEIIKIQWTILLNNSVWGILAGFLYCVLFVTLPRGRVY